jgi:N6-L-threonylcarbamoyladenine synthase
VPEIAARAHVEVLDGVVAAAMREAGLGFAALDAVAATAGPGLIGGVITGLTTGKAIALAAGKPLVAVNHLEGHALTARLTDGLAFPYLLLLVSGGHTQFLSVDGVGSYRRLGATMDYALGEAFDKAAKLLGLGYPGGPAIEARAAAGDGARFPLPRPLLGRPGADFSLSGLKTLAASFQAAVVEIVADRARNAMAMFRTAHPAMAEPALVAAGGVAANRAIRASLAAAAGRDGFRFTAPPARLCGDNGVMIAWAGAERLALGLTDPLGAPARPRWPLDPGAAGAAAAA